MFVYVKFATSGNKRIVKSEDIRHFDAEAVHKKKLYNIKSGDSYEQGFVLFYKGKYQNMKPLLCYIMPNLPRKSVLFMNSVSSKIIYFSTIYIYVKHAACLFIIFFALARLFRHNTPLVTHF